MSAFQSLAPRPPASLETVHNILGSLVARYRQEEVLTAVRQIPARDAKFRPVPAWVTSALAEAYGAKGIQELYSHQASTAELVRDGKNVVVVTPTAASGKTLCYKLPVLNAVLENPDTRSKHRALGRLVWACSLLPALLHSALTGKENSSSRCVVEETSGFVNQHRCVLSF
jgi:hypothetical protein